MMDLFSLAALLAIVFFANFYAASVGGASILILPAMFFFGVSPAIAVGTNRLHRVFATGAMASKFTKEIKLDRKELAKFILISVIGSIIGVFIVVNLNEELLKNIILSAIFLIIILLLVKRDFGLTEKKIKATKTSTPILFSGLFIIAVYRAIIGSAAGTFLRLHLIVMKGYDYLKAAATSSTIAFFSSLVAAILFVLFGLVDLMLAIQMAVAGILGGYLGAKFAIEKGNKFIQALFFVVAVLMILKIIFIG